MTKIKIACWIVVLLSVIPVYAAETGSSSAAGWWKVISNGYQWVIQNPGTSAIAGGTGVLLSAYITIPAIRQRINRYIGRNVRAARENPAVIFVSGGVGAGALWYGQRKLTIWGQLSERGESLLNYFKRKRAEYAQSHGQSVQNWVSTNPVIVTAGISASILCIILYILRSQGHSAAIESALAVPQVAHAGVYKNIEKALLSAALEYNSQNVAQVRAAALLCDNLRVQEMIIRVLMEADAAHQRNENPAAVLLPVIETIRAVAGAYESPGGIL